MNEAAEQVMGLAERGQDLSITGILFVVIFLLLFALYFLVRHYIKQYKLTEDKCNQCQKECHYLELAIAEIANAKNLEEMRKKVNDVLERIRREKA